MTGSCTVGATRGGLMLAAWYDRQGDASEVLQFGEQPDPEAKARVVVDEDVTG